jgi:hypothetical protein
MLLVYFFQAEKKNGKKSFISMWFLISSLSGPDSQVFADIYKTSINNLAGNVYLCGSSLGGFGDASKKGKKNLCREFMYDFISTTDILKSLIMSDGT